MNDNMQSQILKRIGSVGTVCDATGHWPGGSRNGEELSTPGTMRMWQWLLELGREEFSGIEDEIAIGPWRSINTDYRRVRIDTSRVTKSEDGTEIAGGLVVWKRQPEDADPVDGNDEDDQDTDFNPYVATPQARMAAWSLVKSEYPGNAAVPDPDKARWKGTRGAQAKA